MRQNRHCSLGTDTRYGDKHLEHIELSEIVEAKQIYTVLANGKMSIEHNFAFPVKGF